MTAYAKNTILKELDGTRPSIATNTIGATNCSTKIKKLVPADAVVNKFNGSALDSS